MVRALLLTLPVLTAAGCTGGGGNGQTTERLPAPEEGDIAAIRRNLAAFREHQVWSGDRWRTTGFRDGFPRTESIGPWQVEAVPDKQGSVIELRGIRIGGQRSVHLDLGKGILLIEGAEFAGRPITGRSPVVRNAPFKGAVFERQRGSISGKASILLLEDGRALVDFYKVWAKGRRGEYGILSPP